MNAILTRRSFIAASVSAAGGLVVAVSVRPAFAGALPSESRAAPGEVNAFVVVDPDNQITLRIAKSEMGQGVMTSLAMIVAEELQCDFAKIKVEYASANRNLLDGGIYRRMSTGGSSSVRRSRKPDFLAVLDKLADKGDWGKPLPKGSARGLAIHESFGTIVGEIAEVRVGDSGQVKVERVVACVDCGHVVNPRNVAMQIESGVLYGLTAALYGEITIRAGRVEQSNFDDYPIARMADSPAIETHFALSGGSKWGGIGEPGTPPIAPAVANAIFAATGKRIRSLPLKNAGLGV
jgi:CO/xanthine dehydrogenase Mo-binding subunit